ncbi:WD40-repeat-containing domain [Pseudocohnilembus persalinus]|uniref:WD40-repeat-containing domain n=1 Tax=Pseudocohnilembus persalinus TaxID=266149 RepID=A0A0V0QYW3_PSEPJ|nr:WD40-repeat-containing domain [Pseudocohnilembus persalinus]|eukprot:KRX07491.1 WD40-repeat-containing domain [Pseudocohnilembus persalinus]
MGNQNSSETERLQHQLLQSGISISQINRHFPGIINQRQQKKPHPNSQITFDYQKFNEQYYNLTKRISKKQHNFAKTKADIIKTYKLPQIKYKEDISHFYIPNEYELIEKIGTEAYNINISETGDKLLITSRQGLDIYTIKDKQDKYSFDQQVFPGTLQWTITDSDLSRDGNFLIHSTLNSYISMYQIDKKSYVHNFNVSENNEDEESWETSTRCFSVKFNADGSNFIASTGGSSHHKAQLKVYDIRHQYLIKSIPAHDDDINSITYLQKANPNVIVSASDDSVIKIWDTRALGVTNRPQGYLLGHACGITKISSREDGFYLASNSKDQSLKIWDIRKSSNTMEKPTQKSQFRYDYRGYCLSQKSVEKIKQLPQNQHFDNSVMSFYGHKVFKTLIRCHFSPNQVNGGRYVYTASGCGKIFIFDILEQKQVAVLDSDTGGEIVRDVVWHPSQYKIFAAGWDENLVQWKFNPEYQNKARPEESYEDLEQEFPYTNQQQALNQMEEHYFEHENDDTEQYFYGHNEEDEDDEDDEYDEEDEEDDDIHSTQDQSQQQQYQFSSSQSDSQHQDEIHYCNLQQQQKEGDNNDDIEDEDDGQDDQNNESQ